MKKIHLKKYILPSLIILTALLIGFLYVDGWFLASFKEKTLSYPVNNNKMVCDMVLENRRVRLYSDNECIWESNARWKVEDAFITDSDGDGIKEVLLLCWKRGSFGESRPFWINKDEPEYSQHLFFLRLENGEMKQQWFSSKLPIPIRELRVINGKNQDFYEFITKDNEKSIWGFYGFSLMRLDE